MSDPLSTLCLNQRSQTFKINENELFPTIFKIAAVTDGGRSSQVYLALASMPLVVR